MKNIILFDLPQEKLDNMTCILCGGPAEKTIGQKYSLYGSEGNKGPEQCVIYCICSACSERAHEDKQVAIQLISNIEKEIGDEQPQRPTPPSMN